MEATFASSMIEAEVVGPMLGMRVVDSLIRNAKLLTHSKGSEKPHALYDWRAEDGGGPVPTAFYRPD